jgi:hypothetical protein
MCILTFTTLGIVMLSVQHDLIFSYNFRQDAGDVWRPAPPEALSITEFPGDISEM